MSGPNLTRPLPLAALCATAGITLLLPQPELAASCVLLLAASYLLLQYYEQTAPPPPAATAAVGALPTADELAELVAAKLAARQSQTANSAAGGASGKEVLAALEATRKAEETAREWAHKYRILQETEASTSATAHFLHIPRPSHDVTTVGLRGALGWSLSLSRGRSSPQVAQ